MDTITIKLLHERRNTSRHRKIDGKSGKLYLFLWDDKLKAYVYITGKQAELEDLFQSQGRRGGAFFEPVITLTKPAAPAPLSEETELALMERNIEFSMPASIEDAAKMVIAAFDAGKVSAAAAAEEHVTA